MHQLVDRGRFPLANSSQSDTIYSHICKEQSRDWFYSDFVLQSIITIFALFWVWQGDVVSLKRRTSWRLKASILSFACAHVRE